MKSGFSDDAFSKAASASCRFEVAREPHGIEEHTGIAVQCKFFSQAVERVAVASKFEGEGFVRHKGVRHEFRQARGVEEAGPDPAGKGCSKTGQHREP